VCGTWYFTQRDEYGWYFGTGEYTDLGSGGRFDRRMENSA
jgi:hypothetical protein